MYDKVHDKTPAQQFSNRATPDGPAGALLITFNASCWLGNDSRAHLDTNQTRRIVLSDPFSSLNQICEAPICSYQQTSALVELVLMAGSMVLIYYLIIDTVLLPDIAEAHGLGGLD
ncbi:hypothetical protein BJX70DRAFT_380956 [Aspergillus crustosus]